MLYDLFIRYRKHLLVILSCIGLMSLFVHWRQDKKVNQWNILDRATVTVVGTLQEWTRDVSIGLRSIWAHYIALSGAAKENEDLHKQILELNEKIQAFQEVESENNRLRKLLNFSERLEHKMLPAQVVAENLQGELRTIRVNKGSRASVKPGAAVVTAEGVVGRVLRVDDSFADVLTIIDANSAVDGIDQRTRARGVIEGRSLDRLNMKYLQRDDDVVEEDTIVTSGLGGDYPKGIMIGKISKVDRKKFGITQDVVLTPSVDFTKVEEVFIVMGGLK